MSNHLRIEKGYRLLFFHFAAAHPDAMCFRVQMSPPFQLASLFSRKAVVDFKHSRTTTNCSSLMSSSSCSAIDNSLPQDGSINCGLRRLRHYARQTGAYRILQNVSNTVIRYSSRRVVEHLNH
jgi:hypothetical protein